MSITAKLLDRHLGGLVPLLRVEREIHATDGVTYTVDLTWARRGFNLSYSTPRYPRWVRRVREAESRRVKAAVQARLAALDTHPPATTPETP